MNPLLVKMNKEENEQQKKKFPFKKILLFGEIVLIGFVAKENFKVGKKELGKKIGGILGSIVRRTLLNSIVIFSIFILTHNFWSQMAVILPIIISILTSIIFIKTDDLKMSIITGISSGFLTGIYFLSYCVYESLQITEHPTGATNWGMLFVISILFTSFLMFSCSAGSIISYYIRDRYKRQSLFIFYSNIIRILVSSILISVFMTSMLDGNLPFVFSREFTWLNFALPIILLFHLISLFLIPYSLIILLGKGH